MRTAYCCSDTAAARQGIKSTSEQQRWGGGVPIACRHAPDLTVLMPVIDTRHAAMTCGRYLGEREKQLMGGPTFNRASATNLHRKPFAGSIIANPVSSKCRRSGISLETCTHSTEQQSLQVLQCSWMSHACHLQECMQRPDLNGEQLCCHATI